MADQPRPGKKQGPSTDPGPFRSRSLAPVGWAVAAVLAGAALLTYLFSPEHRPVRVVAGADVEQPIPAPPAPSVSKPAPRSFFEPDTPNDMLGKATDLKAVFMRYRDSRDPLERALAGRAHRACFPTFLPPRGQTPSSELVLSRLSPVLRDQRKAAVETLYQRCRSFLVQPMDFADIVATAERVTNGELATPGAAARWAMIRGDRARAEETVQRALASREPYALQSLTGLSALLMDEHSEGTDPSVTDAALALLACDFGAACGADSLLALQLCATEGRCEGTARERMVQRIGMVDPADLEKERARLRALIKGGTASISTVWRGGR
jgi:hypothetical protein